MSGSTIAMPHPTDSLLKRLRGLFGLSGVLEEEREWRRKLILASRKIHLAQQTLARDVASIKGLQAAVQAQAPRMQQLEVELDSTRQLVRQLTQKLADHQDAMASNTQLLSDIPIHDAMQAAARIAELEAEARHLETQRDELQVSYSREITALRREHAEEMSRVAARMARAGEDGAGDVDAGVLFSQSEQGVDDLIGRISALEDAREVLEREHVKQVEAVEEECNARVSDLDGQKERFRRQREDLERRHAHELASLTAQNQTRIRELESRVEELEQSRREVESRHQDQITALTHDHSSIVERLQEDVRALEESKLQVEERHQEELDELAQRKDRLVAELEERIEELNRSRSEDQERHRAESAGSKQRIAELEDEIRSLEKARSELEARHAEQIQDIDRRHQLEVERSVEDIERRAARREDGLKDQIRELEASRERLQMDHAREVEVLTRLNENRVHELELERERFQEERATLERKHREGLADATRSQVERLGQLESRIRELEIERDQAVADHQRRLSEVREENQRRIAELEKLTADLQSADANVEARKGKSQDVDRSRFEKLEARVRDYEREKIEMETQHVQEVIQLADESRRRISATEKTLREKEHLIERLERELSNLQASVDAPDYPGEGLAERYRELETRYEEAIADLRAEQVIDSTRIDEPKSLVDQLRQQPEPEPEDDSSYR